jgi:hypothetical protein
VQSARLRMFDIAGNSFEVGAEVEVFSLVSLFVAEEGVRS